MTLRSRQAVGCAAGLFVVCLLGVLSPVGAELPPSLSAMAGPSEARSAKADARPVGTQTGPEQAPPTSETFFKNVQVLKGIPPDEFMDAMGMFAAALGYDCASCHSDAIHN